MENPQVNSYSIDNQLKPPVYIPSKKPLFIIISLVVFVLLTLLFIIYLIYQSKKPALPYFPSKISSGTTSVPTPGNTSPTSNISSTPITQKSLKIAYWRDDNLWLVNLDGTSLQQLTRDGDSKNVSYYHPGFINNSKLAYSRCTTNSTKCSIYTKDLKTLDESLIFEIPNRIEFFAIDSEEKGVIYGQNTFEGKSSLNLYKNHEHKKILDFESSLGRGGSLSDDASVNFSPNGKYILVVNTSTQPNEKNDKTTLWIFDSEGNLIDKISDDNVYGAVWDGNDKIMFIAGGNLYQKYIKGTQNLIAAISGYNIDFNPTTRELLYWQVLDDNTTQVKSLPLNTKIESVVTSGLSYAQWVNSDEFIALKTIPDNESMIGFSISGLVLVNKQTKEEKVIDSHNSINSVSVE